MKIFGFYISRTDWHYKADKLAKSLEKRLNRCVGCQKYQSKSNAVHDQLRQEVYGEPQPSDNICVGHYDNIKEAVKNEEFGS